MSRPDTPEETALYLSLVGKQVRKKSGKPFKSMAKVATVTGTVTNPFTGNLGYTFAEDDSVVDARKCEEN